MLEVSLRWQDGFLQVAIYSGVIVAILFALSKIEIKDKKGEDRENA